MSARSTLVTLSILAFACACRRSAPAGDGGGAALMTNLMRARKLDVVVEEHALREPLERAAARLRVADPSVSFDAHLVDASSAGDSSVPRVVVGTLASNWAQRLIACADVQTAGDLAHPEFTYAGIRFADRDHVVVATFEDPDRRGFPVSVVFANGARGAAQYSTVIQPAWKPWIRVFRAGDLVVSGPIAIDGRARPNELERVGIARRAREGDLEAVAGEGAGLDVRAARGSDPLAIARYCNACRSARVRVATWCSPGTLLPAARIVVWLHPEEYLEDGDPNALARFDPLDDSTEALLLDELDDGGAAVARAGAWAALGGPSAPWMNDAAGVEAAWTWWGRGLDAWLAHTQRIGEALSIARVVSPNAGEELSAHVLAPRRAALWRFLRETRGDLFVRELWRGTRGLEPAAELDAQFGAWMAGRLAAAGVDHPNRRGSTRKVENLLEPLRGVGTCSESADDRGDAHRGYGTRAFEADLEAATTNGANALLVTSFTRDEPGISPYFGDARWRDLAPREGDVRIVAALRAGSARNMRTLLASHLVTGDGGTWSGGWTRSDRASWEAFFERYARFVEHQGLVAELGRASVLSIGTGMLAVSGADVSGRRSNPSEVEWKRAGWSHVIAEARAAFPGFLTYSASTMQEVEAVGFFGALDYVGFELSPILAENQPVNSPGARAEIGGAANAALAYVERVARANGKRALITQVCFSPDLHGSARALGAGSASREWQARQFRDLTERLRTWSGRPLLAGLFAWRFSGESGAREHDPVIDAPNVRAAVRDLLQSL